MIKNTIMKTVVKYIPEVLNICAKIGFTYQLLVETEANYFVLIHDNKGSLLVHIAGSISDCSCHHRNNEEILRRFIERYNNSWLSNSAWMRYNYNIVRLPNDINGNPRYYISRDAFTDNKGTNPDILAKRLGAVKYRGIKYGTGYVLITYNLDEDLSNLCRLAGHRGDVFTTYNVF